MDAFGEFNSLELSNSTKRVLPKESAHVSRSRGHPSPFSKCLKFTLAKPLSQEDLLEQEMGVDIRYLAETPKATVYDGL